MKNITLGIVLAFFSVATFAQQVQSITIIPSPVTAGAYLQAVVTTVYPGGPCSFVSAFPKTVSNDTIIFDAIYCYESDGPEPCGIIDTFDIGQLAAGTYVVRFRLTSTAQGGQCGQQIYQLRDIGFQAFTVGNGTVGIANINIAAAQTYPNPITDRVNFLFENNADAVEITVLNINGSMMQTVSFAKGAALTMDVSELPANVYFYTIKAKNKTVTGKFAKVK